MRARARQVESSTGGRSHRSLSFRNSARLNAPNLLRVLVDGTIGVELTAERGGDDGGLGPAHGIGVRHVDALLRFEVRREILTDEEVVTATEALVAFERAQQLLELVAEDARSNVFQRFREARIRNKLTRGALGSRRSHANRLERLRQQGFDEATLARVHGPVGLPIRAHAPAEIAVSVLAHVLQQLRGEKA